MDGIEDLTNVIVIGATNRPDMLDGALLRPGRFDRILLVGTSDKEGRLQILRIHTKNMPISLDDREREVLDRTFKDKKIEGVFSKMAADEPINQSDLTKKKSIKFVDFRELSDKDKLVYYLSDQTEGYVGADIESLVREAAMLSLRENIDAKEVKMKHFEEAIKKVGASITKADMDRYRKIETDYLRSAKAALEPTKSYLG